MTDVRKILVVGGGIGGLCTTIALCRAGFDVDLVEKNPAWDVYGVGIIQPGNALRALNELGLAKEAVAQGHQIVGDRTWLADGQTELADNDWPPLVEGLPPGNGITRPRLHHILQTHTLDSGADVRTGVTFTTLADDGDGVRVDFTDGETREYDLVVGADGLYSQVRATVFPDSPKAKYTGQVCWRYNLPRIEGLDKIWVYIGATGTAGFVPLAEDLMYMLTIEKPPQGEPLKLPTEGIAAVYRKRLQQFGGQVAEHRELVVHDEEVVYRPVENVLVPPPWHRGRVVLVGDAAHTTTPQLAFGVGLAVEDGLVLAEELDRAADVPAALTAFTSRRFERCRLVVETSLQLGEWEQRPAP